MCLSNNWASQGAREGLSTCVQRLRELRYITTDSDEEQDDNDDDDESVGQSADDNEEEDN